MESMAVATVEPLTHQMACAFADEWVAASPSDALWVRQHLLTALKSEGPYDRPGH